MKNFSPAAFTRLAVAILAGVVILTTGGTARAQSSTDGSTPLGISPGAPEGSYALSDFDTVNLYNGSLNFHLPLVKISGRGGAGYTMTARIEQKWTVEKTMEFGPPNRFIPNPNWWTTDELSAVYHVGRLEVRQANLYLYDYLQNQTLTRLTFTAPDGTEYELRDQLTNGQPKPPSSPDFDRGRVFVTADGSSATFTADADISDYAYDNPANITPSGYLVLRDGTRYRIENNGLVIWMRDRNGNKLTFAYDNNQRVTSVTDSLNRQVTIVYSTGTIPYDQITVKGFGGTARNIRIYKTYLQNALRSGFSVQTYQQLFPELNGASNIAYSTQPVISAIQLPNGRQYQFLYNSYGELARVVLPTGGAIEYDYAAGLTNGAASGVITANFDKAVYRRVTERRVYPDGGSGAGYASRMTYSRPETTTTNLGYVITDQYDSNGALLNRSSHYFNGSPRASFAQLPTQYPGWKDGREYQTVMYAADGTTPLKQVNTTFAQRAAVSWWTGSADQEPPNDPRTVETDTTLVDTNQVTKQTSINPNDPNDKGFDQFNNQTDVWEYDYGAGAGGALLRHSHTTFVSASSYTNLGLLSLPSQVSVYDGNGAERARTTFEYDNYTPDTYHAALLDRSSISGLDSSFSTSYLTRGNPTGTTRYLLVNGSVAGTVTTYSQFDIAGNLVKLIDPRSTPSNVIATSFDFGDRFGSPDGEARSNSAPSELSSQGQSSYAFATLVTNALGHTTYTQFDYYLGRAVDGEDVNGIVSSGYYNDVLDRPTQVIRASNQGTGIKSQIAFSYDDVNHIVTTTSDQSSFGDNLLKSQTVYDGLGRTSEKRQYEDATNYITVRQTYDTLGRSYQTSNPFRSGETIIWTTTGYDALSRVISVTTSDNAVVNTAYSGNRVLVADQTNRKRISVTDGLGRLKEVWEVTAADSATESVTFPGFTDVAAGYVSRYDYDALDELTTVSQRIGTNGTNQSRSFVYDSLKRLMSATNPESGTICYGTVVNSQCQANGYDANGNLVYKTDARGVLSNYVYDALNRVTSRSYQYDPSGTPAVTYTYDSTSISNGKGRLASVSSSVSTYSYSGYDALGRVLGGSETLGGQTYSISQNYDLAGHVLTESYPSNRTVTNDYDNGGRLSSFSGNLGDGSQRTYSTGISYDSASHWTREQFGTATPLYNKRHYNSREQLYDMRASTVNDDSNWNRGAIVNYYSLSNYGFGTTGSDTNGNLYVQQHWIPTDDQMSSYTNHQQNYSYDSLNRIAWMAEYLNGATGTGSQVSVYDRYGNRTIDPSGSWGTGTPNQAFSVDESKNRLGVPSGQSGTMTYDQAGNLIFDSYSGQGQRTYDAENHMIAAQGGVNSTWQYYTYDGDGRRVKRNVNGTETWQVYGLGGELIAEYAANASPSSPQKEYGYRNGELLVTLTSGTGTPSGSCGVGYQGSKTWPATSGNLGHLTGHAEGSNWAVYAGSDPATAMVYGPYDTSFGQGHHNAQFWLMVDNNSGSDVVATLDVVTGFGSNYLAQRQIHRNEFAAPNQWQVFTLEFDNPCFGYLESRVLWQGTASMKFSQVTISSASTTADVRWLVTDQLGTPRMIFDQSGSLANVSQHDYLPFGEELFAGVSNRTTQQGYTGDSARQKFTQKERDNETGLDFFEARYYASTQGRFTSPDPLLASGRPGSPQSWNRYSYVMNNPGRLIDPSGLTDEDSEDQQQQQKQQPQKQTAVNDQLKQIKKDAKPLQPGEKPVPTTMRYLEGEQITYNGEQVMNPDGTPNTKVPVYGTAQVNAVVVLDQGGNIMGSEANLSLLENVRPDSKDAIAAAASNDLNTSNKERVPQSKDGLFFDRVGPIDSTAADRDQRNSQPYDVQVKQRLYVAPTGQTTPTLYMDNTHRVTNSGISSVIGKSKPWPRR
jgi:RHS repeat-associated protein